MAKFPSITIYPDKAFEKLGVERFLSLLDCPLAEKALPLLNNLIASI